MVRSPCCESEGLNRGPWAPEEDQILVSYIQRHGHSNWRTLPKLAGLQRCGKSCRLRWMNYLRPDIKRGNFTREEEDAIIHLHQLLGNRWSVIAARLPGRTDNEIKNVWHTHLKKRLPGSAASPPAARKPRAGSGGPRPTSPAAPSTSTSCHSLSASADALDSPSSTATAAAWCGGGAGGVTGFDGARGGTIDVDEYFVDGVKLPPLEGCESGGFWPPESPRRRGGAAEDVDDFWMKLLMEVEATADSRQQLPIDHLFFS